MANPVKKSDNSGTKASSYKSTEEKLGNDTYRMNKAFRATKSGKLISEATQDYPTRGGGMLFDKTTTVMDTTGYSKGKKSFPAKRTNYSPFDTDYLTGEQREVKTQTFDVPRNKVKKTIKEMKSNTGMLQKEKVAKLNQKPKAPVSTKTVIDRNGKKTTKAQYAKIVKPTADSTAYYSNKATYLTDRGVKQSKIKDWDGMNRDFDNARKAIDNQLRQSKKGKPGYDKNGFPVATKAVKKPATSTKTVIDRNGKKTTKTFKPVRVNKSEAFKKGGKKQQIKK